MSGQTSEARPAAQTGRPSLWTQSTERKLASLYVNTTLPLAEIVKRVHKASPEDDDHLSTDITNIHNKLNAILDKEPRWLHPRTQSDMDCRIAALKSSPTRQTFPQNRAFGGRRDLFAKPELCNELSTITLSHTISKDNTAGDVFRQDCLLGYLGQKLGRRSQFASISTPRGSNSMKGLSANEELKRQYEHFLRRNVLIMIKRELEACVNEEFGNVALAAHGRLSSWIQSSAERCARAHIFKHIPTPTEAASQPDPEMERAVPRVASPVAEPFVNLSETLVAWPFPPPVLDLSNFTFDLDQNGMSQSLFEQYEPAIDYTYESGSLEGSSSTWRY